MCGLFGRVERARRRVEGDVLAINLAHWKDTAGRAEARNVAMMCNKNYLRGIESFDENKAGHCS